MTLKREQPAPVKKRKIIRVTPGEKVRPSAESLERLRRTAEEKGWARKNQAAPRGGAPASGDNVERRGNR
jgi:hypothetical protein